MPIDKERENRLRSSLRQFISDQNCCSEMAPRVADHLRHCAADFKIDATSIQLAWATIPFKEEPTAGCFPCFRTSNTEAGVHTATVVKFTDQPELYVIDTTIGQFKKGMEGGIQRSDRHFSADFVVVEAEEWRQILKLKAAWSQLPDISYQNDSEIKSTGGIADFLRTVSVQDSTREKH